MLIRKKLKSKDLIIAFSNDNYLSPSEIKECKYAENSSRYFDWIQGRSALKKVFEYLNKSIDVAKISFPDQCFSISHTKDCAVAIGVLDSVESSNGVGIDLELSRKVDAKHTRYYLSKYESDLVNSNDDLLRLWTVKEALFKADPSNDGGVLKNYNVKNPKNLKGEAVNKKGDIFYYNSIKNPVDKFLDKKCGGWMTWAINHS